MTSSDELYDEAKKLREQADAKAREANEARLAELGSLPLLKRLRFAATARCLCGAGLAYDRADPKGMHGSWDCSAILLGTAIPSGQPGAVQHTGKLPFAFYEVKSEDQPSANGMTTRPPEGKK